MKHVLGLKTEKNEQKLFEYLNELFENDDKPNCNEKSHLYYLLGRCHELGIGTKRNPLKALQIYQKSSELNNSVSLRSKK